MTSKLLFLRKWWHYFPIQFWLKTLTSFLILISGEQKLELTDKLNTFQLFLNFYNLVWRSESQEGNLSACRRCICACVETAVEVIAITAVIESRFSADAKEISLTVSRFLIESIFTKSKALQICIFWTFESEIAGSIAVADHVRPVAVIRIRIECETFRTFENVSASVHAVQKLIAKRYSQWR